jgi:hypothetical protein
MPKSNPLCKYLRKMAKQIKNSSIRRSAYREIKNHLNDKVDHLKSSGLTEEEAIRKALEEATDPKRLGKSINRSHRPWFIRRPLILASLITPPLLLAVLVLSTHLLVYQYFIPLYEEQFDIPEQAASLFIKDLKQLQRDPLFKEGQETFNSSASFAHRVPLSSKGGLPHSVYKNKQTIQEFFHAYDWPENLSDLQNYSTLMEMDLSWLEQLWDYEHWNTHVMNENEESYNRQGFYSHLPMNQFFFLQQVTLIYANQKIRDGQLDEAFRLPHHIARLLYDNHTEYSYTYSRLILKGLKILANQYNYSKIQLPSDESIEAFSRAEQAWRGIFQKYMLKGQMDPKWLVLMDRNSGFCSALKDLPTDLSSMSDYFLPQSLLEPSFITTLHQAKKQKMALLEKCNIRGFSSVDQGRRKYKISFHDDYNSINMNIWEVYLTHAQSRPEPIRTLSQWLPELHQVPFVRRLVGMYLMITNRPGFFKDYTNKINENL